MPDESLSYKIYTTLLKIDASIKANGLSSNVTEVENKLDEVIANLENLISNTQLPFGADYMEITSKNVNGDPLVIVYKKGGASGTVVNTTTITYDVDGDVQTVTNV